MSRSIFGWSLPPGVTMNDIDPPSGSCEVCGGDIDRDDCICPECPVCSDFGNPRCYIEHGLRRTEEQKFLKEVSDRAWEDYCRADNEYWEQMYEDEMERDGES